MARILLDRNYRQLQRGEGGYLDENSPPPQAAAQTPREAQSQPSIQDALQSATVSRQRALDNAFARRMTEGTINVNTPEQFDEELRKLSMGAGPNADVIAQASRDRYLKYFPKVAEEEQRRKMLATEQAGYERDAARKAQETSAKEAALKKAKGPVNPALAGLTETGRDYVEKRAAAVLEEGVPADVEAFKKQWGIAPQDVMKRYVEPVKETVVGGEYKTDKSRLVSFGNGEMRELALPQGVKMTPEIQGVENDLNRAVELKRPLSVIDAFLAKRKALIEGKVSQPSSAAEPRKVAPASGSIPIEPRARPPQYVPDPNNPEARIRVEGKGQKFRRQLEERKANPPPPEEEGAVLHSKKAEDFFKMIFKSLGPRIDPSRG